MDKIVLLLLFSVSAFSQSIEQDYANKHYQLGNEKRDAGDLSGALEEYKTAINFLPHENIYFNKGAVNDRLGNFKEAIDDYTNAISLNSSMGIAYYNRAYSRGKFDDFDGSCDDFRKAFELGYKFSRKEKNIVLKGCGI